jgi:hypothetical protein
MTSCFFEPAPMRAPRRAAVRLCCDAPRAASRCGGGEAYFCHVVDDPSARVGAPTERRQHIRSWVL